MKLFITYARVDTPICKQIVDALDDIHDVWWDKRLFAGQDWWQEIQRRLNWADGLVYLLSPESIASEYCNKEFNIARKSNKKIFPVLIQARTKIPEELGILQYADLSQGLENVHQLLNAITLAERDLHRQVAPLDPAREADIDENAAPEANKTPMELLREAGEMLDTEDFDKALFALKALQERSDLPRSMTVMVEQLSIRAEAGVERQAYLRKASREYEPIVEMVTRGMRDVGCEAFRVFRADFPDYDPENLAALCGSTSSASQQLIKMVDITAILPTPFEWVEIEAGPVTVKDASAVGGSSGGTFSVERFLMARYPVSNAQFNVFLKADDGYRNPSWWSFCEDARQFFERNPGPKQPIYDDHLLPRTDVNWYEAMAFCKWLSARAGQEIALPTEAQWQRAAQGDENREYPWGHQFDVKRCNTNLSGVRQPTPVDQYPNGASPFGVLDMSGNVFEWCLTDWETGTAILNGSTKRVLRGGSWFNDPGEASATARNWLNADLRSSDRGFRVVIG